MSHRSINDWWELLDFPSKIVNQHFGVGFTDEDIAHAANSYFRPRQRFLKQLMNCGNTSPRASHSHNENNEFRVALDVSHFNPDELEVKTVDGNWILVEANHGEKQDEHGFVSRQFTRKYKLPNECEADKVVSLLTPEGILVITAPKKSTNNNETVIPIKIE
ncbi:protein lethal(2)essential for life-like protein [Leptotrombidium deliense]|uniref:Protein lethal(2)essential for life-like protein n=1 Tax=Leptotrombidium deliense TaxID=299467 RepID=A0A443RZW8_9ACAR|nr:protein lethal(2)essential for life-like protein [Leptotrombidium deliense]